MRLTQAKQGIFWKPTVSMPKTKTKSKTSIELEKKDVEGQQIVLKPQNQISEARQTKKRAPSWQMVQVRLEVLGSLSKSTNSINY